MPSYDSTTTPRPPGARTVVQGIINLASQVMGRLKFANLPIITAGKLLGRRSTSDGDAEEITVGTGLLLSGSTLSATATATSGGGTAGMPLPLDGLDADEPLTIASPRQEARYAVIGVVIGNGSTLITTGVKGFVRVPVAGVLAGWTLLSSDPAATPGSIVVDVWKDTYANYPPADSDSITNGHEPTISSATKNEDTDISDWATVLVAAGDVIGFNVDSVTSLTQATLELTMRLL